MTNSAEPCPYFCESGTLPAIPTRPASNGGPRPGGASARCPGCAGKVRRCTRCAAANRLLGRFCRRCKEPLAPWAFWTGPRASASGTVEQSAPWSQADVRWETRWASDQLPDGLSAASLASGCGALYALGGTGELVCLDVVSGKEIDRQRPGPSPIGVRFSPGGTDAQEVIVALGGTRLVGYIHQRRGPDEAGSSNPTPLCEVMNGYPPRGFTAFSRGPVIVGDFAICALSAPRAFGVFFFDLIKRSQATQAQESPSFAGHLAFLIGAGPGRVLVGSEEGSLRLLSVPEGRTIAEWQVVRGMRSGPALSPCVLGNEVLILDADGRLWRCILAEGSPLKPVGQVEVSEASALVAGPDEISIGDQKGRLWRFTAGGLEGVPLEPKVPGEAAPAPVVVSPVMFADGCSLAPGGAGSAMALLPRPRMARAEMSFSFPQGGTLSALLWLDGIVVGATARGEVSTLEVLVKEA